MRLLPIEMKGRNARFNEKALESMNDVLDEMEMELRPIFSKECKQAYVLFGFSLGAWIAFELARRLEKRSRVCEPGTGSVLRESSEPFVFRILRSRHCRSKDCADCGCKVVLEGV